jgi:hypothetical protein
VTDDVEAEKEGKEEEDDNDNNNNNNLLNINFLCYKRSNKYL